MRVTYLFNKSFFEYHILPFVGKHDVKILQNHYSQTVVNPEIPGSSKIEPGNIYTGSFKKIPLGFQEHLHVQQAFFTT